MSPLSDNPPSPTLNIFVVEDNADTLKYLKRQLERQGHRVEYACTMEQALADLRDSNCEVLLSDIGLPDGDGWQLLKEVQLARPIYAIAMSGYGMAADRARSKEAGFRHHLLKPFSRSSLDALLTEAIQEKLELGKSALA